MRDDVAGSTRIGRVRAPRDPPFEPRSRAAQEKGDRPEPGWADRSGVVDSERDLARTNQRDPQDCLDIAEVVLPKAGLGMEQRVEVAVTLLDPTAAAVRVPPEP